ncbi:hypothetical protein M0R45_030887 [Rubus argutus]|uniref:Uncharacterized protein n=1 Tax=Rubus argutus TaxID=59490 RepID=A0AAW1WD47_RUBAR
MHFSICQPRRSSSPSPARPPALSFSANPSPSPPVSLSPPSPPSNHGIASAINPPSLPLLYPPTRSPVASTQSFLHPSSHRFATFTIVVAAKARAFMNRPDTLLSRSSSRRLESPRNHHRVVISSCRRSKSRRCTSPTTLLVPSHVEPIPHYNCLRNRASSPS